MSSKADGLIRLWELNQLLAGIALLALKLMAALRNHAASSDRARPTSRWQVFSFSF